MCHSKIINKPIWPPTTSALKTQRWGGKLPSLWKSAKFQVLRFPRGGRLPQKLYDASRFRSLDIEWHRTLLHPPVRYAFPGHGGGAWAGKIRPRECIQSKTESKFNKFPMPEEVEARGHFLATEGKLWLTKDVLRPVRWSCRSYHRVTPPVVDDYGFSKVNAEGLLWFWASFEFQWPSFYVR